MKRIMAGIVTFNHDSSVLLDLVSTIAPEVAEIVIVTSSIMTVDE